MEQTKNKRPLIEYIVVKPFVDATTLGLAIGGPSSFYGNFWPGFIWGTTVSFAWYWIKGNLYQIKHGKQSRTKNTDYLTVNTANGTHKVRRFEQEQVYITRDENTFSSFWNNVIRNKPQQANRKQLAAPRPAVLDEFTFQSKYSQIELLESDVKQFLISAWRNKNRGHGLSQRRWVRDISQRPQWYKDLGPSWYFAFLGLLRESQQITGRGLVTVLGHQQYGLKHDPRTTLSILKWTEAQKENVASSHKFL